MRAYFGEKQVTTGKKNNPNTRDHFVVWNLVGWENLPSGKTSSPEGSFQ